MTKTPRWHERINVFNNFYHNFVDLCGKYDRDLMRDFSEKQQLFNGLKICYEFYCKSLRDILNFQGDVIYLPVKVLISANEAGLINDAEVWLDYIKDMNCYYQTYGASEQQNLAIQIINKYKSKLLNSYNNLNKFYNSHICNEDYGTEEKILCTDSKPLYTPSDVDISEYSYNILLNYLKSNKYIKYVWLHGSRAKGNARKNSDIDFLIDIGIEYQEDCKAGFYNLTIPYRVDFVSINDLSCEEFVKASIDDTKLIYRAEDFR